MKMMCAPLPSRLAAHDFALAGLLLFVSQVSILSGRPLTPPLALIWPMRIFAAASAGLSNGAMFPLLSNAQPITIGDAAFVAEPPSPVPATATDERRHREQRPEGAPPLPCRHSCLPLDSRSRDPMNCFLRLDQAVQRRVQRHGHAEPLGFADRASP